jgi:hypothetical protein
VESPGFPQFTSDEPAAVAVLWSAERVSQEPERGALRALRTRFDELIAGHPESLHSVWLDPSFLTYLRVERPSYWNIGDTVLHSLSRCVKATLSRVAPEDALYVVTAHRPEPEPSDTESPVLGFVGAYLVAHGQPTDELTEDNAFETLARYAELPWSRP